MAVSIGSSPLTENLHGTSSSTTTVWTAIVALVLGYVVYYRYYHPLAKCPGPFMASITNLWSMKLSLDGDWPQRMDALHKRYGPIVRIAPNEVCIDDPQAIPIIYGLAKGFYKTAFYPPFGNPAHKPNPFNATEDKYHAQLKRWYGPAFTMKAMLNMEEPMQKGIALFLQEMRNFANGQHVMNIGFKLECLAFDVSALVGCGREFGAIENGDQSGLMHSFSQANIVAAHVGRFPAAQVLLSKLAAPKDITKGFEFAANFLEKQLQRHEEEAEPDQDQDQMSMLIAAYDGKPDNTYTELAPYRDRIKQAAQVPLAAGSETTGTTLTALFYWLTRTPEAMEKLVAEIDSRASHFREDGTLPSAVASEMPYLLACIKEALRIHPAVSFPLPRIVPSGGANIAGRFFPGGTQVGVNAWQIHQHEEIFGAHCARFRPERWLETDQEGKAKMEKYLFSFGAGSRTCIGKNLSLLEMRLAVPAILHRFTIRALDAKKPLEYRSHWFALANKLDVLVTSREV